MKFRSNCYNFVSYLYEILVQDLKKMAKWSLIKNQPLLKTIFKRPSIISYKRGKSLKDMLVRAKV